MFELNHITGNTYYISGPTKIGVYRLNETDVCLIDTGIDKKVGQRILQTVTEKGWNVSFIINTHAHADHVGGNAYIESQTGCKIYASTLESGYSRYTEMNSCNLYGAYSPKELRRRFFLAEPSGSQGIGGLDLPDGLKIIDLSGHSAQMIGVETPDKVLFLGDALISRETLEKFGVTYIFNVKQHLKTLKKLKDFDAEYYVPSHAEVTKDIDGLININRDKINENLNIIINLCKEPISFENLLKSVFGVYNVKITFEEYALIESTVKSYLTYLSDNGVIRRFFEDNVLMFEKVIG